jgi:hypothetical protein
MSRLHPLCHSVRRKTSAFILQYAAADSKSANGIEQCADREWQQPHRFICHRLDAVRAEKNRGT